MHEHNIDDTIAAPATPAGEGGIGIVRISGAKAIEIADSIFVSKDGKRVSDYGTYTVHYGQIVDIDEVLLTVMRAPKSYTKEDVVEINCHGGIQAVKKVFDLVIKRGARTALPGEFTRRAFLNGRIDLAQAEAVLDVIRAKTEGSLKAAVGQLEGRLSKDVSGMLDVLVDIASGIEASIDFPDEELDIIKEGDLEKKVGGILDNMKGLIESFSEGVVLREGVLAVICGKPNVGKSSLMNLLLKRDRVIVTPVPGTTRDAVEEMISLNGVPIRLVDTAGIGEVNDVLYRESAGRSKRYIDKADIILLMLDASTEINEEDMEIIELVKGRKKLVIMNKIDLNAELALYGTGLSTVPATNRDRKRRSDSLFKGDAVIEISVDKKININLLERSILDMVWSGKYAQGESAILTNARHKELLDKAFNNMLSVNKAVKNAMHPELIAVDLKDAIFNLGLIVGRSASDDILDKIFENFCIGK
ncbi:MAG: tRNA uridine-5-carboxymethylaminomethyl(34) synthesis GTPase MnmE [Candidatus Omnitrophota bacterium]|jgi:tRNA modification GTPase|nr:tRNA uridine-5-carboxymethylaminomethyl(34) synthesis GTPase MnmE [Candidatus Omnitrophota bacterium]